MRSRPTACARRRSDRPHRSGVQPPRLRRSSSSSWRSWATSPLRESSSERRSWSGGRSRRAGSPTAAGGRTAPRSSTSPVWTRRLAQRSSSGLADGHAPDQRLVTRAQELELVLHLDEPVASVPRCARSVRSSPPSARRGASGRPGRRTGGRRAPSPRRAPAGSGGRASVRGQHEADQSQILELVQGRQHGGLVVADDRLAVRRLVAGAHQGVDRQRVLLGRREALLTSDPRTRADSGLSCMGRSIRAGKSPPGVSGPFRSGRRSGPPRPSEWSPNCATSAHDRARPDRHVRRHPVLRGEEGVPPACVDHERIGLVGPRVDRDAGLRRRRGSSSARRGTQRAG